MKNLGFVKGAAITLACLGAVTPQQILAVGPATSQVAANSQIADIALVSGTLNGKVVNGDGQLLSGSVVKISQGNREVATTFTSETGEFAIHNLSGGVYQVSAGQAQGTVRVWDSQIAPPAAKSEIMMVSGQLTARGQECIGGRGGFLTPKTLIIGGVIIAAAIAIPIALDDDDDDTPASP